jgi:hypothetical protein
MHYRVVFGSYNCHNKSYSLIGTGGHKPDTPTINSNKSSVTVYPDKYSANRPIYSLKRLPNSFLGVYDKVFS